MLEKVPPDLPGRFWCADRARVQASLQSFDDALIAIASRRMAVGETRGYLVEMYGSEVSRELTRAVAADAWPTLLNTSK